MKKGLIFFVSILLFLNGSIRNFEYNLHTPPSKVRTPRGFAYPLADINYLRVLKNILKVFKQIRIVITNKFI